MRTRYIWVGSLLLTVVILLAACNGTAATPSATEVPIVASDAAGTVVAEAVIEPVRSSTLSFEMGGTVTVVLVKEGDAVKAGDPLARLSTTDLERALAKAELGLAQAELQLDQVEEPADESDIAAAESAIAEAEATYAEAVTSLRLTEDSVAVGDDVRAARWARDEAYRTYQELQAKFDRGERWIERDGAFQYTKELVKR